MHWGAQFVGKKWVNGARGPDEFDCWGLLVFVYRTRYGITLPDVPGADYKTFARLMNREINSPTIWRQIEKPVDGCAVALGSNSMFYHVGLWLDVDGGLVLHAVNMKMVIATSLSGLKPLAIRRIEFYKHSQWPTSSK